MAHRDLWLAGALSVLITATSYAQVPPPPPPSPTLWSFLGIPQGLYKVHAQLFNRRGNFPGLEKKPPLKAIADVENLKSEVPAIKAAAEIKQAEDLKPQKIKAIKYLASIGCGCYDKDEKITKALLAATEDCTEDVRLEAVRAVELAAQGEACAQCKQKSCCNEKLVAQLSKIAYERDDKGCYVEPSERVREAAIAALCACCPGGPPTPETAPTPVPVEGVDQAPAVEGVDMPPGGVSDPPPPVPDLEPTTLVPPIQRPDRTAYRVRHGHQPARPASLELNRARVRSTTIRQTSAEPIPARAPSPAEPAVRVTDYREPAPVYRKVSGHIVHVAPSGGLVHLHLDNDAVLPAGTPVQVLAAGTSGTVASAVLEVTASQPGWANARPAPHSRGIRLVPGTPIESWR